jgi:heme/copper-type cytochrome/quinol oxidase subunit 2
MSFSFADGLFWLSVACCALAQFFILRSVGATRRASAPDATLPRQRGAVEMLWAVLPAVGLAVLLVFTWRAVRSAGNDAPPPASPPSPGAASFSVATQQGEDAR